MKILVSFHYLKNEEPTCKKIVFRDANLVKLIEDIKARFLNGRLSTCSAVILKFEKKVTLNNPSEFLLNFNDGSRPLLISTPASNISNLLRQVTGSIESGGLGEITGERSTILFNTSKFESLIPVLNNV